MSIPHADDTHGHFLQEEPLEADDYDESLDDDATIDVPASDSARELRSQGFQSEGLPCQRESAFEVVRTLWEDRDPRFLSCAVRLTCRIRPEQRSRLLQSLFRLVRPVPRAVAALVARFARAYEQGDPELQQELVESCARGLERTSFPMRSELFAGLLKAGRARFAQALIEVELQRCPPAQCGHWLHGLLVPLSPSLQARLDRESLLALCLERILERPSGPALDPLFKVMDLRDVQPASLREKLLDTWSRSLLPEQVHVRHRERLYFVHALAESPALRSRLLMQYDLAQMSLIQADAGLPQHVLGRLVHFPKVLKELPEEDAVRVIAYVLRRLFRRLTEQDHERIADTLLHPDAVKPFMKAYKAHLLKLTEGLTPPAQLEVWGEFFGAWMVRHMNERAELIRPMLKELLDGFEVDLRKALARLLKRRFGYSFSSLMEESSWQSWLKPFFKKG